MTQKVILEFNVSKEKLKSLMAFLDQNLGNVRNFDGCSQVKVFYNPDKGKMLFDEVWESIEQHKKYLAFIGNNGVMMELSSLLASQPEIKYFDIVDL